MDSKETEAHCGNDVERAWRFWETGGRFQKMVFFFFCLSMVPNGFVLVIIFVSATPNHQCSIPAVNLTQEWLRAIIPVEVVDGLEQSSRCSRYRLDLVLNLSSQGFAPGDVNLPDLPQEPCVDGWSYSRDVYQSTIVSQFDLVCSDQWKQPLTTTVHYLGVLVGSFVLGQVSDRFGRKPVFFSSMFLQSVFMFVQVFSTSWSMFTICWFLSGFGNISNYVSAFILGAEILSGKIRVLFLTLGVGLGFAIGYSMLPLFAFFLRDWTHLQMAMALPSLLFLPFWWVIPESPRWLLSQGRVDEAEAIVKRAAKMNKVKPPLVVFENYRAEDPKARQEKHHTVLDLFRTRNIRAATVILCLLWLSMSAGYYGVTLNSANLVPDPYLGCFIAAVVEIPAYVSSWLALGRVRRRLCTVSAMLLGGVSLLLLPAVPRSLRWLSVTMEMIGKFSFAASTNILFAFTAEVFPTVLRNTATGICSTSARVGTCLAPFILQLGLFSKFLPPVILGSLSAVSAIGAFFLPETFRRPLPETIDDMQQGKRIHCHCLVRKEKTQTEKVLMESKF
ncbi:hypothetical protein WMY93_007951 [Mugilogobius chulae]|uniref:Major facilitator superfamily (MFS) profile domain-containing protein n=1 Tax=Mugilogobius chulae TaxID=88201 RepID=A0AAW0PFR0_9GOBI